MLFNAIVEFILKVKIMDKKEDIYREDSHQGPMMTWHINQQCNFSCQYCFLDPEKRKVENPSCNKFPPSHIAECFNRTNRKWWIFITGGEPFLYRNFVELCQALTQKHMITVSTNFSTSNVKHFASAINPEQVYSICASLHIEERLKKKNGLTEYIKNVKLFQSRGFQVRVVYVVFPKLFPRLEKDIAMLQNEGVELVDLKVFSGYYNLKNYPASYTKDECQLIKKYILDTDEIDLINKKYSFFGKKCRSGIDYFMMDNVGNIRRCVTSTQICGNFFSDSFQIDTIARPCVFQRCGCIYEGMRYATEQKSNKIAILREAMYELPGTLKKITPSKIYSLARRRFL